MKIAVFFPGIGYTCDKPLLYYSSRLAQKLGYEIKTVPYGGFQKGVKGDPKKKQDSFYEALKQTEEILQEIDFSNYEEILMISKSIGTIVSGAYVKKHGLNVRSVLYTPLEETFLFTNGSRAIAFHGNADSWADTDMVTEKCREAGIPLCITEGANHSLETGDPDADLDNLKMIMKQTEEWIKGR